MSRLYAVRLVTDIVVFAESEEQAGEVARQHHPDEKRFERAEAVTPIVTAEDLPHAWDGGCIPYGRQDDVTVGEILGEKT